MSVIYLEQSAGHTDGFFGDSVFLDKRPEAVFFLQVFSVAADRGIQDMPSGFIQVHVPVVVLTIEEADFHL